MTQNFDHLSIISIIPSTIPHLHTCTLPTLAHFQTCTLPTLAHCQHLHTSNTCTLPTLAHLHTSNTYTLPTLAHFQHLHACRFGWEMTFWKMKTSLVCAISQETTTNIFGRPKTPALTSTASDIRSLKQTWRTALGKDLSH